MLKTKNEILNDINTAIMASAIPASISGEVYKQIRPTDSEVEDCIFNLIQGISGKFLQSNALFVKIFYKDINDNNTFRENTKRGSEIERLLMDFSETLLNLKGYSFDVESREFQIEAVDETKEHFCILKINLRNTTK